MQARKCDRCGTFYDDGRSDDPTKLNQLEPKVVKNIPGPFKLGRGKQARPFVLNCQIFPCIEGAQGQVATIDLCPRCKDQCIQHLARFLAGEKPLTGTGRGDKIKA